MPTSAAILRSWEATIRAETVDAEERAERMSQHSQQRTHMRHCVYREIIVFFGANLKQDFI